MDPGLGAGGLGGGGAFFCFGGRMGTGGAGDLERRPLGGTGLLLGRGGGPLVPFPSGLKGSVPKGSEG